MEKILEAGRLAPTAKNIQPQKIYVVQSQEGLEKIDKITPCRYGATTVLMVCGNKNISWTKKDYSSYETDACIVATHMMLEAWNLGIASVWIRYFDARKISQEFNLDQNIRPIFLLPIGYKSDKVTPSPSHNDKKELNEIVEYL